MINETYELKAGTKKKTLMLIGLGLVLFILGIFLANAFGGGHGHGAEHGAEATAATSHHGPTLMTRIISNLWLDNIYFLGIAVIGVFFVAIQYVAQAGWSSTILRVPMSFGYYMPIGGLLIVLLFLADKFLHVGIFHWLDNTLYDPKHANYDSIIAGKTWFLGVGAFVLATIVFVGLWTFLYLKIRNNSIAEDSEGGVERHKKNYSLSAIFLVVFAVSSSIGAWYWIMSIDTHWFSTMFGWYVFASWFVAGLCMMTLVTVLLRDAGYMSYVTENHLHDLGKFIFGFSIFWTYIFFSQFFLYWYANIPEEVVYFQYRFENYKGLFFVNLFVNFLFPFLALMTRDAKRHTIFLKVVTVALLFGHWLDFYMMIMPGTVKSTGGFGLIELGSFMMILGVFLTLMTWALSKAGLVAKNHPMLDESMHHHI